MDMYLAFGDLVINAVAFCTAMIICVVIAMTMVNAFSD